MTIVAVIPAYNEQRNIRDVVEKTRKFVDKVVVVDDGSKDKTFEEAELGGAFTIKLAANMGVGFATRIGCDLAVWDGADVIVTLDADGQHDPADIKNLVEKIEKEGYEFVLASRMMNLEEGMPSDKMIGNKFLSACCNLLFGCKLSDTQSGFRAFTREAYLKLDLTSDGYEICSEYAYEVTKKNLKYCEIPISASYNEWTKVKGTNIFVGVKIFLSIILLRLMK